MDRADLRVGSYIVKPSELSYIVQRHNRFYVVAYDGLDPLTGRERRRWHPVGSDPGEAEALAKRLQVDRAGVPLSAEQEVPTCALATNAARGASPRRLGAR